jgi:hypothetical protein
MDEEEKNGFQKLAPFERVRHSCFGLDPPILFPAATGVSRDGRRETPAHSASFDSYPID